LKQVIVADSSPLISFARAGKLHIVQLVYAKIVIPPAVYEEIVVNGKGKPGAEEIRIASWIKIEKPMNKSKVEIIEAKFGPGESEAIVLAEEIEAVLLADEVVVIKEARKRGLQVTSTHLILEEAKRRNLIKSAKVELDGLIASGFRTTPGLIRETLRRVGEY